MKLPVSEGVLDPSVSLSLTGCKHELATFEMVSGAVADEELKMLVSGSNLGADGFCLRAGFQKLQ